MVFDGEREGWGQGSKWIGLNDNVKDHFSIEEELENDGGDDIGDDVLNELDRIAKNIVDQCNNSEGGVGSVEE